MSESDLLLTKHTLIHNELEIRRMDTDTDIALKQRGHLPLLYSNTTWYASLETENDTTSHVVDVTIKPNLNIQRSVHQMTLLCKCRIIISLSLGLHYYMWGSIFTRESRKALKWQLGLCLKTIYLLGTFSPIDSHYSFPTQSINLHDIKKATATTAWYSHSDMTWDMRKQLLDLGIVLIYWGR